MSKKKICLTSDNWIPAHPLIIKAINDFPILNTFFRPWGGLASELHVGTTENAIRTILPNKSDAVKWPKLSKVVAAADTVKVYRSERLEQQIVAPKTARKDALNNPKF